MPRIGRAWAALPLAALLSGCGGPAPRVISAARAIGDPAHGVVLIKAYGCGACHEIPGVSGARGLVAPPLTAMGRRTLIAGLLPNTAPNMVRWLRSPQSVVPGNGMPDMGMSEDDAKDIAAYLHTLR